MNTLLEADLKNLELELELELEGMKGMKGKEAKSKKQETRFDEVSRMRRPYRTVHNVRAHICWGIHLHFSGTERVVGFGCKGTMMSSIPAI